MKTPDESLIRYRLERARETYAEALLMRGGQRWNGCVNRLYYACYYAATALLLSKDLSSSKHSGTRALLNKHFVKTNIISTNLGELYNTLFDLRQESDYEDYFRLTPELVEPWVPLTDEFITRVEVIVSQS